MDTQRRTDPAVVSTGIQERVVITGIGVVTPLGNNMAEVVEAIRGGACAAGPPDTFDGSTFDCPVCARLRDFDPRPYISEPKLARLMNRDAQLAVSAARLALEDAGVKSGETYAAEKIALFGATGLSGLPLREVTPLLRLSAGPDGNFDLCRFGQAGLKAVSPILSFKILGNMPVCFVSINEAIQGPNAIYTPWEGEGIQALEAGVRALRAGEARCALVGGCDMKTHELAFATLQQEGLFASWARTGKGVIPGEGAAFLVLETEKEASARQARAYCGLGCLGMRPQCHQEDLAETRVEVLRSLNLHSADVLVGAANGDEGLEDQERAMLEAARISIRTRLDPKKHLGDLFAAAGLLQVATGAALVRAGASTALINCFGHGGTQAALVLEGT